MSEQLISFIRDYFRSEEFIPLHAPVFSGKENAYVADTITSTFVSSVGAYVDRFEQDVASYTDAPRAIATVNGTAALHIALKLAGVKPGDLVITQPLTFVATCNAIAYCGAEPLFIDVDLHTLGLSPTALESWLSENAQLDCEGVCRTKEDHQAIRACVPMHTFGHPADLDGLVSISKRWNLALVEDAAESLGSFYKGQHTGTFGELGTLSFNGNKIMTTGGGGMILANQELGAQAKHLTTTAKKPHAYEYIHDQVGYNYRMPNLNAALGCAQLEQLEQFIAAKRVLAESYRDFFHGSDLQFFTEPEHCRSNYWLNAVICQDKVQRDALLKSTNDKGVMTRPVWALMNNLAMYQGCRRGDLSNSEWLEERVVNLPSSVLQGTA
ncbi:aminotransferase in exopolysaccharide biosynthesis [Marinobacter sp. LV10R520-4]|uniref:LegC family aminotransferase n=1 Tax=Marinobacter sp. LV10R520-4 TaxID=1761796 RepID=UPI000BF8348D|nr:LegC family aminotransferase [Marinobacter sp. LV10R520-4]PFG53728.1 aminotransferase in exopolysaccharide biosynthesis [Marinobacter sp. LV10R520-4]